MNSAKRLFKFDDDEQYYSAREIMAKLGRFSPIVYDTRIKERVIGGHRIRLVAKQVYDVYIDGKIVKEGVERIGEALEDLNYCRNYSANRTAAKKTVNGIIVKTRWIYYDGKKRSEKVQSSLL